jgi:hypothetical protein
MAGLATACTVAAAQVSPLQCDSIQTSGIASLRWTHRHVSASTGSLLVLLAALLLVFAARCGMSRLLYDSGPTSNDLLFNLIAKHTSHHKGVSVKKITRVKKAVPVTDPAPVQGKYFLRSLHQEIDLYDRKLAYLERYEVFASDADREGAERKLQTKRATLESAARKLAAEGVEFNEGELPRSFRAQMDNPEHV